MFNKNLLLFIIFNLLFIHNINISKEMNLVNHGMLYVK